MAGLYPSKLKEWEQKQVGYHETGKNINKYAADMDKNYPDFFCTKKQGLAWCGVMQCDGFCETYGEKNALKMLYMPKKNLSAVVKYLVGYFKKADAFYDDPEDGDLIAFKAKKYVKKDNPEGWYHVGYVESYDKKYVYTIEGNSGDAVKRHKYSRSNAKIGGYCRPDYDEEVCEVTLNVLQRGDKGTQVATLQIQLNGLGIKGKGKVLAVDKSFGPATEDAVKNAQIKFNLEVTGVCDEMLWTILLKG